MPGFRSSLPLVERVFDAVRINEILNYPRIRPFIADMGAGVIDLSLAVGHPDVIILLGEYGGFVLHRQQPGVFEVHTHVLPEGRGKWADAFIQAGIRWMFTRTEAFEILTRVPQGHLSAKALTIRSGMAYEFTPDLPYQYRGRDVFVDVYSLRIQDWAAKAPEMEETGRWLHQRFAEEGEKLGLTGEWRGQAKELGVRWGELHEDRPSHNRYVGLVYHMAIGGNLARGVFMYNRWALISRRPKNMLAKLVSSEPPVIWFDHTTLKLLPDADIEMAISIERQAA